MTRNEEMIFEKKAEKEFKGQRPLQNGRDFRWNKPHWHIKEEDKSFRANFDRIFPNSPGAGL